MIPSTFDFKAPGTVAEALALLADDTMDVKVLAGGQSLLPVLKLRMADPELVVSLAKIDELRGVHLDGETIVIGAMTRHADVATDAAIAEHAPLLTRAAGEIADPQVRHRGTIGGAVVHADPASDMPATLAALEAEMTIVGASGERTVPAAEFFVDFFTTVVEEDEILTSIRVPTYHGWGVGYQKFTRVAQQWPIVSVAAMVRLDGDSIAEARVALGNMDTVPIRASSVERALADSAITDEAVAAACTSAAAGTNPTDDLNGDATYRRHLATVLTRRAVLTAAGGGS